VAHGGIYSELPNRVEELFLEKPLNFSEEIIKMPLMLLQLAPPAAVQIAETLLHTWIRGDLTRLEVELDRTAYIAVDEPDDEEKENLQLLKSIAARMKACPNMYASRSTDPGLDLCVDLLAHLSSRRDCPSWPRGPKQDLRTDLKRLVAVPQGRAVQNRIHL
jgi:hypothetical protein